MEQDRLPPCHQGVNGPLANSAIKQVKVIIMDVKFRGSTEFHRVMEGDYIKFNISWSIRSLIMDRNIHSTGEC